MSLHLFSWLFFFLGWVWCLAVSFYLRSPVSSYCCPNYRQENVGFLHGRCWLDEETTDRCIKCHEEQSAVIETRNGAETVEKQYGGSSKNETWNYRVPQNPTAGCISKIIESRKSDKYYTPTFIARLFKEVFPIKIVFELEHERWEGCLQPALRKETLGEWSSERKDTTVWKLPGDQQALREAST